MKNKIFWLFVGICVGVMGTYLIVDFKSVKNLEIAEGKKVTPKKREEVKKLIASQGLKVSQSDDCTFGKKMKKTIELMTSIAGDQNLKEYFISRIPLDVIKNWKQIREKTLEESIKGGDEFWINHSRSKHEYDQEMIISSLGNYQGEATYLTPLTEKSVKLSFQLHLVDDNNQKAALNKISTKKNTDTGNYSFSSTFRIGSIGTNIDNSAMNIIWSNSSDFDNAEISYFAFRLPSHASIEENGLYQLYGLVNFEWKVIGEINLFKVETMETIEFPVTTAS